MTPPRAALALACTLALAAGPVRLAVWPAARADEGPVAAAPAACPHRIAERDCPFCHPERLESEGWCRGHGVPEAVCTRCWPALVPAFQATGDWCAEHGLPESQCRACGAPAMTPPAARPAAPAPPGACPHGIAAAICPFCDPALLASRGWCREHAVPEAVCTRCDPRLIPAFRGRGDWCGGHDLPESQCVACDPARAQAPPGSSAASPAARRERPPTPGCSLHEQPVRLASDEVARQVGIVVRPARRAPLRVELPVHAELGWAAGRHAHLAARAAGVVRDVPVALGQEVAAGDPLVRVDAPALGAARTELVQGRALLELWERNHARELELARDGLSTQRAVIEADTRRAEARAAMARAAQALRGLGVDPGDLEALGRPGGELLLLVRAPFAGVVVERDVAPGEVVEPGRTLVTIGDPSLLWALLRVPEQDAPRARVGQAVAVTVEGLPGEVFAARLTWISPEVDRRTRTVAARAELDNRAGRLRVGQYATARLALVDRPDALLVPRAAVQWEGCCNVVFLPAGPGVYAPRKVRLGELAGAQVEVLDGLAAGEEVVTEGSFLLKTELLKDRIGAGCCEVEESGE